MAIATGFRAQLNYLIIAGMACSSALALELGVDAAVSSSPIVSGWGASSHIQVIHPSHFGIDIGYRYFSDLSYQNETFGPLNQPRLQQYELSLLRQFGDKGIRIQALLGPSWSGDSAEFGTNTLIERFDLGYHADVGISVPVFTRFRAFAEMGYQGWIDTELPNHLRWRYGLRLLFGQNARVPLASELAESQALAAELEASNSTVIDERVPRYIPGHLSESLPPIVELAEVCKCFPAGPYTLQLGEFANINQAMRALEFRGLRQFFNSRAFERNPQPVFLAQVNGDGAVALYMGELPSIETMEYWRRELKKSGISARMRAVLNTDGQRVENPMMGVETQLPGTQAIYSAEEIRQMNSVPATELPVSASLNSAIEPQPRLDVRALNSVDGASGVGIAPYDPSPMQLQVDDQSGEMLQVGPLSFTELGNLLADDHMRRLLASNAHTALPGRGTLTIDETEQRAWLNLGRFNSSTELDHWRVVFESMSVGAELVYREATLTGDITTFGLAGPGQPHTIIIARAVDSDRMMVALRSAEVLWFDAFANVNNFPVGMALRWSEAEQGYQLITEGIANERQRRQVLEYLVSVGLLPNTSEGL